MKTAGIYIHIPFCAIKCMYCDFYSVADREDAIPKFVKSIIWEIENCSISIEYSEKLQKEAFLLMYKCST